jgi:hypothetical protein
MKTKHLLCPQRLRRIPHQFSWIDQRLVGEGHIARCGGAQALALYLLLVTVADSQGLSYYSDKTAARLLSLSQPELRQARNNLLSAGLIAYQAPLYQVLSLEPTLSSEPSAPRTGQTLPISTILRQILVKSGLITRTEVENGRPAPGSPKATPALIASAVPGMLAKGRPKSREVLGVAPFKVGQRVRARNIHPTGHARLPRYPRGKLGTVHLDHGVYVFPDANADSLGE